MGVLSNKKKMELPKKPAELNQLPEAVLAYYRATGAIGGRARVAKGAAMLTPEQRKERAMLMVKKRREKMQNKA